jgi:hypothetical protein
MPGVLAAKPDPATDVIAPGPPLAGVKVIAGDSTVNVAEASTAPPTGTSALTEYVPAATVGTVKFTPAPKVPVPVVVTGTWISPASKTLLPLVSNQTTPGVLAAKPPPVTTVVAPGPLLAGVKVMVVGGTVNGAEVSTGKPDGISAITEYVPAVAVAGTVKVIAPGIAPAPLTVTAAAGSPVS